MDTFPLHTFLVSLAADGILLTIRDYEHLHLALQTGGKWDIHRVKNVILSLIAKSEEQQRLISRRFDKFFQAELAAEKALGEEDISRVLADLMQLSSVGEEPGQPKRFFGATSAGDSIQPTNGTPTEKSNKKKEWKN